MGLTFDMPYMVDGEQTTSSGVWSGNVDGPKTAILLGAKMLGVISARPLALPKLGVKTRFCFISLRASKMFSVPCTFTL